MSVADEVKKLEGEVVGVEKKVVAEVEAAIIDIKAEEKLVISKIVNEYLKVQLQLQGLNQQAQDGRKKFEDEVKGLIEKYVVDTTKYVFNEVDLVFKKIEGK